MAATIEEKSSQAATTSVDGNPPQKDSKEDSTLPVDDDKKPSSDEYEDVVIEEEQLGVYRLLIATTKSRRRRYLKTIQELRGSIPYLVALFREVYSLAPGLFVCLVLWKVWVGLEGAVLLHLSTRMLRLVEAGFLSGTPFVREVLWALGLQSVCAVFMAYLKWHGQMIDARLRGRVISHFEMKLMAGVYGLSHPFAHSSSASNIQYAMDGPVKLNMDVPTSLDATSKIDVEGEDAWDAFCGALSYLTNLLTTCSQIIVISSQARVSGDPFFVLVCILKPIYASLTFRALWQKVCYAYVNNLDYLRMCAMKSFSNDDYKQDVLSGDLGGWIIKEYESARDRLKDISNQPPFSQYFSQRPAATVLISALLEDLPTAYCGINAVLYPARFSIASLAILQRSSSSLRYSLDRLLTDGEDFQRTLQSIKQIYTVNDIRNKIFDGKISYPPPALSDAVIKEDVGMSFELKNVTFAYPGSTKTSNALDNINLSIPAGALVVVVGSNGSGKSTIVRILSRLFSPTSGELLIDGIPADRYHIPDLRRATTLLSQDNKIYPLSFAENIGLGCVESMHDKELVKKSADQGGASEFISKLSTGFETRLNEDTSSISMNLYGREEHPLHKKMDELQKSVNISGGETQRLAAARSFMRLNSGKIKFVVVDEPSSALDAEGELQLFHKLLEVRQGKTMIFVTHRFGHLTKFADTIICLKDGKIAETGSHSELLAMKGEYAKLYDIQAKAFSETHHL